MEATTTGIIALTKAALQLKTFERMTETAAWRIGLRPFKLVAISQTVNHYH
jgi:hypothetical protein